MKVVVGDLACQIDSISGTLVADSVTACRTALEESWPKRAKRFRTEIAHISEIESDQEIVVNIIAFYQKSLAHWSYMADINDRSMPRTRIWQRYMRNTVDAQHGHVFDFKTMVHDYLHEFDLGMRYESEELVLSTPFSNPDACLVSAMRFHNMVVWCRKYTVSHKLTSDKPMKWQTFDKITKYLEQPIVIKRRF